MIEENEQQSLSPGGSSYEHTRTLLFRRRFLAAVCAPSWHHDLLTSGQRQRVRPGLMHPSEIMTIVILFHQSHYRTFKAYYSEYVHRHLHSEFETLASYGRFASVDAHGAGATGRLPAHPIGPV
jgi:hypothetical protein